MEQEGGNSGVASSGEASSQHQWVVTEMMGTVAATGGDAADGSDDLKMGWADQGRRAAGSGIGDQDQKSGS